MGELRFVVNGMRPVPWGSNEWAWRGAIAAEARSAKASAPGALEASGVFEVRLLFRMGSSNIDRADLDNLAKPVLDTVFLSRNAQVKDRTLTGALFDVDDDRVFRLDLEKRLVSSDLEEGVDVCITWR